MTSKNRMDRILGWLSSECDVAVACYQTLHGGYGLASGGWGGLGLGESREKWSYLPAAHNDFIFAILGEELGLIGTLLVLALFGLLAFAMIRIIRRHPDPFVQITTGAILCWIIGQALVNIAVVIGLAPVIGVPLPLVSAGGSALDHDDGRPRGAHRLRALGARRRRGARRAAERRAPVARRRRAVPWLTTAGLRRCSSPAAGRPATSTRCSRWPTSSAVATRTPG